MGKSKLIFQIRTSFSILIISFLFKILIKLKFWQLKENSILYNFFRNSLVRILSYTMPKVPWNVVGAFSGRIGLTPAVTGWAASCDGGP